MAEIKRLGAFTLLAVACLTIMVGCVIVPGLTKVAEHLGTPEAASWLVTVPSLGVVIFGPFAGWFIDRAGTYRALCWGLFLYGLLGSAGMFLYGLVPVMLDRLLLGGATAIVMSAGTGLISSFYSGQARLKMIASQGMSIELGGVMFRIFSPASSAQRPPQSISCGHSRFPGEETPHILCFTLSRMTGFCTPENAALLISPPWYISGNCEITEKSDHHEKTIL